MFAQLLIGEQYKSTYTRASTLLLVSILHAPPCLFFFRKKVISEGADKMAGKQR